MRIEHIGKSTVKVTVSGSELERLGLRYEDLGENILFGICRSLTRMGVMSENSLLTGEKHCLRLVADIPKSAALPEGSVTLADDISLACIKEHGRVIIPHNALNTLLSLNFNA